MNISYRQADFGDFMIDEEKGLNDIVASNHKLTIQMTSEDTGPGTFAHMKFSDMTLDPAKPELLKRVEHAIRNKVPKMDRSIGASVRGNEIMGHRWDHVSAGKHSKWSNTHHIATYFFGELFKGLEESGISVENGKAEKVPNKFGFYTATADIEG